MSILKLFHPVDMNDWSILHNGSDESFDKNVYIDGIFFATTYSQIFTYSDMKLKRVLGGYDFNFAMSNGKATDFTGGTVTGTAFYQYSGGSWVLLQILSGFSVPATVFAKYYANSDVLGLIKNYELSGGDTIYGSSGNDTLIGYGPSETFIGGGGSDRIEGGGGVNTVRYAGPLANYRITSTGSGYGLNFTIRDNVGSDGTESLYDIQNLQFSDQTISIAPAPVISSTQSSQRTQDNQTIAPFSGVAIVDYNAGETETLTVTLSEASKGTLSHLGGGTYDVSTGIYTVSGSLAAVTAALHGLTFTPNLRQIPLGSAVQTVFTITDTDAAGARVVDNSTSVVSTISTALQITDVHGGASLQSNAHVSFFAINDTASNVRDGLSALLADSKLISIALTDATKPTIALSQSDYVADTAGLAKISTDYNLVITGATVAQAVALQSATSPHATIRFGVSDKVANIAAGFSAGISALPVTVITATETAPLLVGYDQWAGNANLVAALSPSVTLIVDRVDPADYSTVSRDPHVTSVVTTSGLTVPLDQAEYLYIAYFGRAAEPGGLSYWAGLLNGVTDLHNAAMGFGTTAEAAARYALFAKIDANVAPTSDDITTFLTTVYQNLLNRSPDPGGLAYWASIIQSRLSIVDTTQRALQIGAIPADLIGGAFAGTNAGYRLDQATLQNKVGEAEAFSAKMALVGPVPSAEGLSIPLIASVDSSIASRTSAKALGDGELTGQTGLTASNVRASTAAFWQADAHIVSFTVKDTASAVFSALPEMINDSKLASVTVSGTSTAHSVDLTNLRVASTVALGGNSVSVSAGLASATLSFIGSPDRVTLGSAVSTVNYALQPSSGIETIFNFQYGLDRLDMDLLGAANIALQVADTSVNSAAAISLYSSADPTHGVVLTAGGTSNFTTAADLLANHLTFSNGHAVVS